MTTRFPVTITTAEELRLLEERERSMMQLESPLTAAVFDDFDTIRAHGLGVKLEEREWSGLLRPEHCREQRGEMTVRGIEKAVAAIAPGKTY